MILIKWILWRRWIFIKWIKDDPENSGARLFTNMIKTNFGGAGSSGIIRGDVARILKSYGSLSGGEK